MKVILLQEVKKLGKKGALLEVSEGYARNYLLPHKLAAPATVGNINVAEQQKAAEAHKARKLLDEAKLFAAQLAKLTVNVAVRTGDNGKLFGSVTSQDVADALKAQHGIELDKRKIELKDTVKNLGTYPVTVKLHPEISAKIEVQVTAK